jgi:signal-transduction protein with cAMP-binding, CBS, and nucleotidyltransferase domain
MRGEKAARDYVKSHARTVRDVMTRKVISVDDTTDLAEVAAVMETNRIKRVPVMRDGRLVGIISRANLVRALVAAKTEPVSTVQCDDSTIRQKLLAELRRLDWVTLWAQENVPGVRGVEEHIVQAWPPLPAF